MSNRHRPFRVTVQWHDTSTGDTGADTTNLATLRDAKAFAAEELKWEYTVSAEISVIVKHNSFSEFEVPTSSTLEIYFTDDREDAIATAQVIHGSDINVAFRRGTYIPEEA